MPATQAPRPSFWPRRGRARAARSPASTTGAEYPSLCSIASLRRASPLSSIPWPWTGGGCMGAAWPCSRYATTPSSRAFAAREPGFGTALLTRFDCAQIAERTDQSSWPRVSKERRGPSCDFARAPQHFADRRRLRARLSSARSLLRVPERRRRHRYSSQGRAPSSPLSERPLPIWRDVAFATDAPSLVARASDVGLEISERTAYRILAHEIKPLPPLRLQALRMASPTCAASREVDLERDRRSLRLSQQVSRGLFSEHGTGL